MGKLTKREEGQFSFMARCYDSHSNDERRGYRSALFDATHLLDAARADLNAGRPSKAKAAEAARLKRLADLIWGFREDCATEAGRAALARAQETSR